MSSNAPPDEKEDRLGFPCPGCGMTRLIPAAMKPKPGEVVATAPCSGCGYGVGKLMFLGHAWKVLRETKNATKNARMKLVIRQTPRRENRCSTRVLPVGLAGFEPATS